MPQLLADGPLGLESYHRITNQASTGTVLCHTRALALPAVHFDRMPGWRSVGEIEDLRDPKTMDIGEHTYPALMRGKSFSVEGRLIAESAQEARQMEQVLKNVLVGNGRQLDLTWDVIPDVVYGTFTWTNTTVRCLTYEADEEWTHDPREAWGAYQMEFSAGFRMSDPRWYSGEAVAF